ncbi:MAG: UDP-3-O-[3-hydroxymyristoyl] N-acetylglucosamine deacetylase [Deltaproteobacteria bacterium]|nr:MAG: UDP-3-O-[3-hydroxymyristoyl] N-acetylglucosamine deacetylase [Deltaproteobacteria bacterium]
MPFQTTLRRAVSLAGVGLHTGRRTRVRLGPAAPDTGYVFVHPAHDSVIPAGHDAVVHTTLATTLGNQHWRVATVEHLLAALRGMGLDNVEIEVDGDELPALDGSARPWVDLVQQSGVVAQQAPARRLVILRPVEVVQGDRWARLCPARRLEVRARIDFDHKDVGRQELELGLDNGQFVQQLSWARTFGFLADVEHMRAMGLGMGGGLHNAVVFDDDGPLNPEGLRAADELVRHKILDMIGDLALLGHPVIGRLEAVRPGHALTVELIRTLVATPDAWTLVEADDVPAR